MFTRLYRPPAASYFAVRSERDRQVDVAPGPVCRGAVDRPERSREHPLLRRCARAAASGGRRESSQATGELTRFRGHIESEHERRERRERIKRTHLSSAGRWSREQSGRTSSELAREYEPSAGSIRNWVAQHERDGGQRSDGLSTDELLAAAAAERQQTAANGARHPNTSGGLVRAGERLDPREGFEFVKANQAAWPTMCRVLGLSPSGYYAWVRDRVTNRRSYPSTKPGQLQLIDREPALSARRLMRFLGRHAGAATRRFP